MHTRESITNEVFSVVQLVRGVEPKSPPLTLDTQIVKDLGLGGDDAYEIILLLKDRTGIKAPNKEWRDARTIGDIVEVLLKYAPDTTAPKGRNSRQGDFPVLEPKHILGWCFIGLALMVAFLLYQFIDL